MKLKKQIFDSKGLDNDNKELHPFTRVLAVLCYVTTILYLSADFYPSDFLIFTYSIFGAILLFCTFFFISAINRLVVLTLTGQVRSQSRIHGFNPAHCLDNYPPSQEWF
jgi:hypothetical protein